jgi:hypothetical protein
MKLIKILITMTLLNAIFVVGLVKYAAQKPVEVLGTEQQSTASTSDLDTQTVLSKPPEPTITPTRMPSATKSPVASKAPTKTATPAANTATPKPTVAATAKPTPTPTPAAASGCVVTVDGASYNITSLVKSHSGGNVFKCGTDMSSTFNGASPRHKISWMTKYKI